MKTRREQRSYLASLIESNLAKGSRVEQPSVLRTRIAKYYLRNSEGELCRVCRDFFCGTFRVSHKLTTNIVSKLSPTTGRYTAEHGNIGRVPPNLTSLARIRRVREFIFSIPKVPSHYCRKHSKKLYFEATLNMMKLYKLYLESRYAGEDPVSYNIFVRIIHEWEPRLGFFKPKKDQCTMCNNARDHGIKDDEYHAHIDRKEKVRAAKEADKAAALANAKTMIYLTFDLEAVLTLPYANDSQLHYSRKLSVMNFTVYDSKKDGFCYVWDETQSAKGSHAVSSCLRKYLKYVNDTFSSIKHVVMYCDTCGGQNRNQNIVAAMLHTMNDDEYSNIEIIDLKYFESGHSQMECDSMHSRIEKSRKDLKLYTPHEYVLIMETARKHPRPYNVTQMSLDDFLNLEDVCEKYILNRKYDTTGQQVKWLKIKWFRFERSCASKFYFKYDTTDSDFRCVDVSDTSRRRNVSLPSLPIAKYRVPRMYSGPRPISVAKKRDLTNLLRKAKAIPATYAKFYESLPTSKKVVDYCQYVTESDAEEEEITVELDIDD